MGVLGEYVGGSAILFFTHLLCLYLQLCCHKMPMLEG